MWPSWKASEWLAVVFLYRSAELRRCTRRGAAGDILRRIRIRGLHPLVQAAPKYAMQQCNSATVQRRTILIRKERDREELYVCVIYRRFYHFFTFVWFISSLCRYTVDFMALWGGYACNGSFVRTVVWKNKKFINLGNCLIWTRNLCRIGTIYEKGYINMFIYEERCICVFTYEKCLFFFCMNYVFYINIRIECAKFIVYLLVSVGEFWRERIVNNK